MKTIRIVVFLSIIFALSSCKKPVSVYKVGNSGDYNLNNHLDAYDGENKVFETNRVDSADKSGLESGPIDRAELTGQEKIQNTYGPSNVFTVKNIKEDSFSKGEKASAFSPNSFQVKNSDNQGSGLNSEIVDSEEKGFDSGLSQYSQYKKVSPELVKQKEAKLADIPVPMSADPIMEYFNVENSKKVVVLGYYSDLDASKISRFYNQEMELYGWEKVYSFDGLVEKSILFKKPSRYCSISIRSNLVKSSFFKKNNYKTQIVLFSQI